jgi:hypothetical protein
MILKDGSNTENANLDRLIQFDERSRAYSISDVLSRKPLRSYTWRCTEWFDQGREGACVAYSLGHELASRPAETRGIHDRWLIENVYWEAQKIDPWPGGAYPQAKPFYEGTSILAGVKVLHKKEFFREYRWSFNLTDLLQGLGRNGPAVLGLNWYSGMMSPDRRGFIHPTGRVEGGHAILARGVNIRDRFVILRNSWGKSWGVNGDCYISFDNLERLLHERGESVFLVGRTAKFHKASI